MYPTATDSRGLILGVDSGPLAIGTLDVETGRFGLRPSSAASPDPTRVFTLLRRGGWPIGVDVLRLIDMIRSRVAERLGVELETELEIW